MIASLGFQSGSESYCQGAHDATLRHRPPDVKREPCSEARALWGFRAGG